MDKPKEKYIALYVHINNTDEMFGLLYMDTEKKCLLVPTDSLNKVTVPWKPFYFTNNE